MSSTLLSIDLLPNHALHCNPRISIGNTSFRCAPRAREPRVAAREQTDGARPGHHKWLTSGEYGLPSTNGTCRAQPQDPASCSSLDPTSICRSLVASPHGDARYDSIVHAGHAESSHCTHLAAIQRELAATKSVHRATAGRCLEHEDLAAQRSGPREVISDVPRTDRPRRSNHPSDFSF